MSKSGSGWLRLWLLLAVIYLVVVGSWAWLSMPSPELMAHQRIYYSEIPPDLRVHIQNANIRAENEQAFISSARDATYLQLNQLPNGHTLVFSANEQPQVVDAAVNAYWEALERDAEKQRIVHLLSAFALWLSPLVCLYLLGIGIGWVYRGFVTESKMPEF